MVVKACLSKQKSRLALRWLVLAAVSVTWLIGPVVVAAQPNVVDEQEVVPVVVELFYRGDSEQSLNAVKYAEGLQGGRQGIQVKSYDVLTNQDQLKRLWELSRRFGLERAKVPSFYVVDRLIIGFPDADSGSRIENLLTINAYVRPGCKHCEAGKRFLDDLVHRRPGLRVKYHDVVGDLTARREVQTLAAQYKVQIPSFPCIEAAGRLIVGFQTAETTGARIEALFQDRSVEFKTENHPQPNPAKVESGDEQARQAVNFPKMMPSFLSFLSLSSCARLQPDTGGLGRPDNLPWVTSDGLAKLAVRQMSVERSVSGDERQEATQLPENAPLPEETPAPDDVQLPDEVPLPEDFELPEVAGGETSPITQPMGDYPIDEIDVPWLGRLSVSQLGLPTFTFLIGLVDGFNPCAMWVLIFLLSVLVNLKDRKKILIVAGTFVVVSGLAYFVFMAAWFNVFQLIGLLRPVQVGLGIVAILVGVINIKDFFAFHKGVSLSIPESAKPGIYRRVRQVVSANSLSAALGAAIVLAVVVNIVELLCTAGLPALYTQILTMQDLPPWANYSYLALYIAAYMLDDTILVLIVVATLSHRRLQESEGRWLKLLSGIVILALGMVMIFWPDALI